MKKYVVMSIVLMIGSLIFAQKKEVKAIEKAIKSGSFAEAKSGVQVAEGLLSAMDNKTKAKFYFLKGQALYANGAGTDNDVNGAISAFDKVSDIEKELGKFSYTSQINEIKQGIVLKFFKKGQDALSQKKYTAASNNFETAYRMSPKDTLYLYNSAVLAMTDKNYDTALKHFDELINIGYTGKTIAYLATEVESGEEQAFPSKQLRDASVISKTYINPRDDKKESKISEITKNIALIYVEQGKNDEAIKAINKAKSLNPDDYNLLIAEANIRYRIGEIDAYRALIQRAIELQPDNVDLLYNLGVVAAEIKEYDEAQKYYDKALAINPKYVNALVASSVLLINQEQAIVDEMNGLGTSAADDKRFEELKAKRNQIYLDAIPYLEKAIDIDPKNLDAARTLMSLYSVIDDMEKFKAMKAKVQAIESGS